MRILLCSFAAPFLFAGAAACALLPACGSSSSGTTPAAATLNDGLPATCSPIRPTGACMLPWPNAIYLNPDASTKTGYRMALPMETLPKRATMTGTEPTDPTRYNMADGFSPAGPLLANFDEWID